jgi:putative FmdB family regulatory protein
MPLYDYAPKSGKCKQCKGRFEVMQRVAEPKLKRCPACGKAVERLISKVALGGKYSVSDGKVKSLGLTRYKKAGDGVYERTAGSGGPAVIQRKRGEQKTDFDHPIRTVSDPWD